MFMYIYICKYVNMYICVILCIIGVLVQFYIFFILDCGVKLIFFIDRNFFCGYVYNIYYLNDMKNVGL